MRIFLTIFVLWVCCRNLLAQDTVVSVAASEQALTAQESYLTRYLSIYDKGMEADEIIADEEGYLPDFEGMDSIFKERLESINSLIHLPYNEKVRAYIDVYISKKRNQTKVMLALAKYYFPIFERELAKQNLPQELKYVAIIESKLDPRALSRQGAGGLWQFIYRTGKVYGLQVDKELDERFDAEKSTVAAVSYLKYLYGLYNDWVLALAAYNCGPGNVRKAIRRAKNKKDYWEIYNYLPSETRGYIPAFIGATYAMIYYREHGITVSETDFPEINDTLKIAQKLSFERIAHFTGAPIQTIRDYNPQYKLDYIPGRSEPQTLKLPANYILKFIEYQDTILAFPLQEDTIGNTLIAEIQPSSSTTFSKITYRVKRGDNLSMLAVRFKVNVAQIKEWNMLDSDVLKINQSLTIYTTKSNVRDLSEVVAMQNAEKARAAELAVQKKQQQEVQQTTRTNKDLASSTKPSSRQTTPTAPKTVTPKTSSSAKTAQPVARKSTSSAQTTQRAKPKTIPLKSTTRNMQSRSIAVVQSRNAKNALTGKFVHYRVKSGETLFAIQRKHPGSNIQEIINMNNLRDNGNKIYPNQVLKIRVN